MEKIYQWLAVSFAAVLLIILWLFVPVQKLQAEGIVLPTGLHSSKVVVPSNVLTVRSMPLDAKQLGTINIERSFASATQNQQAAEIISKAKQLAASVGANQIVLRVFFHTPEKATPPIWIFRGVAIYSDQNPLILQPGVVMPSSYQ